MPSSTSPMRWILPTRRYIARATTGRIRPATTIPPRLSKTNSRTGASRPPTTAPSPITTSRTDRTGPRSSFVLARWRIVNNATSYVAFATPMTIIATSATTVSGIDADGGERQAPEDQSDDLDQDQPLGPPRGHREERAGEAAEPECCAEDPAPPWPSPSSWIDATTAIALSRPRVTTCQNVPNIVHATRRCARTARIRPRSRKPFRRPWSWSWPRHHPRRRRPARSAGPRRWPP